MNPKQCHSNLATVENESEKIYYGWIMLPIAMLAMMATSPSQTFGISVFNESFRASLGLSNSELTGAYLLGTLFAALPMCYIGALADRHGLRATMTGVIVLFGLACLATPLVSNVFTLFLAFLALRMLGQGALGLLSSNTLAFWFERRLGTVEGIRQFGLAGAIAAVPALNLWMIQEIGWQWAFALAGLTVWLVMLPLMFFFRNHPGEVGQFIDGHRQPLPQSADDQVLDEPARSHTLGQARRTRAFWIVLITKATWSLTFTGVVFNIVPIALERGMNAVDAAALFTAFAISLAAMQIVGGMLADRFPLHLLLAFGMASLCGVMAIFWTFTSTAALVAGGILMGVTQGLLIAATGPLFPRYFGRAHLNRIRGFATTIFVAASSLGPFVLGVCKDLVGSYDPVLAVFTLASLPLVPLALWATNPRADNAAAVEDDEPMSGTISTTPT
ncbi:MAG: MFS transporter [Phycisphaeraceae bacterium]